MMDDSEYIIGSQTLREIERIEQEERNRIETEVIGGSQNIEEENISVNSITQHKSLVDRFRVATQKQNNIRKLQKTKSDNAFKDPEVKKRQSVNSSLSLSRMLQKRGIENIDLDAWENSMEKYISPNKSTRPFPKSQVSSLAQVNEEEDFVESDHNDIDNVNFIEPQKSNLTIRELSQCIEEELMTKSVKNQRHEWTAIDNSKCNLSQSISRANQSLRLDVTKDLNLISSWNLPQSTVNEYKRKGVERIFDWQSECLQNPKVLFDGANLVYSAPTSAGKTLVSEILMIKNVLERRKKAIFILPFVSIVREKTNYLQELMTSSGVKVDGYYGGYYPARGFDSLDIIVGTFEKANSIINRMLEENKLEDLGMIVIDEIHSISDSQRGYLLELLLTKVLFMCDKFNYQIQLVGMSATLPNVDLLCQWLKAEFYTTNFRPVELKEMIKIDKSIYDRDLKKLREIQSKWSEYFPASDVDDIFEIVMETIGDGLQVIIFCSTKAQCEILCRNIAHGINNAYNKIPKKIESIFNLEKISNLKQQGDNLTSGFDVELKRCIGVGCAFHHAGLTTDERELVELGFKSGALKLLVATSTLSAGVNLPSRRVIIREPTFMDKPMDTIKYQQMIGRAGRKGQDTLGESILVCNKRNERFGKQLMTANLNTIQSCLDSNEYVHLKRAILEIISSNMANTREDLESFVNHTLFCQRKQISFEYLKQTTSDEFKAIAERKTEDLHNKNELESDPIKSTLNFLLQYEFVRLHYDDDGEDINFVPTKLGLACLSSSLTPMEGFCLFQELIKARQNFVLECDLHAIYLVTPYSITHQLDSNIDWTHYEDLYDKLPEMMKRVGKMVGISAQFFLKAMRGRDLKDDQRLVAIHKRFYIALALQDLVNEVSITEVSNKFKIRRSTLQSLQQSAAAFAGTVTNFCEALEWNLMVLIIKQFRERLFFGIHPDLIDLMKIPSMTSTKIARALYKGKIKNLNDLAIAKKVHVEDILLGITGTNGLFMSGQPSQMPVDDVAKVLIRDAQNFLQSELGVQGVKWIETQISEEPKNVSKVIEKDSFKSPPIAINSRKRKGSTNSPQIDSSSYKRKLRSSGSITDLPQVQVDPDSSFEEVSYENVSLFNNDGISLDDDALKVHNNSGAEKFLTIIDVTNNKDDVKNFSEDILKSSEIYVSVGVGVIQSKAATIGGNVLKTQKSDEKFIFKEKFYASCISFCCESNKVYHIDLQQGDWLKVLRKVFSWKDKTFCFFECKENLKVLKEINVCSNLSALKTKDPKIAAWFFDPEMNFKWNDIVDKFAKDHVQLLNLIDRHKNSTSSIGLDYRFSVSPKDRTAIEAFLVKELLKSQKMDDASQATQKSQTSHHIKFFTKLEMPIQNNLAQMEINGFPVDKEKLHEMIENCNALKKKLEDHIYRLNGGRFDMTNKSAVAKAVGINKESGKKLSTAKEVLAKIESPIAACISTCRTLSTTIANLTPMTKIVKNGRVHGSSFSLTQTGRISMYDPNLQNVTKDFVVEYRDINGKEQKENVSFRSAFRCKTGKVLLSADFCQLELRILTHLCKDPSLITAMEKSSGDIFRKIAADWNKINETQVTDEQRNQTKQLCYAVIYGMGTKALALKMDVDEDEAKKIVDKFHATYKTIQKYNKKVIEKARKEGYIETVTCRRRYLPMINSQDRKESSKAERQAFNSTIQGSASDLVKNAIVTMDKNLKKKKFEADDCVLVLHLHDELFYEVKEEKWREAMDILVESMERTVKLKVPLKVKVKMGTSWGEMQDVRS